MMCRFQKTFRDSLKSKDEFARQISKFFSNFSLLSYQVESMSSWCHEPNMLYVNMKKYVEVENPTL